VASDLSLRAIISFSVVFGVTLTLLAINTSSSVFRKQQTTPFLQLPATSVANLPRSGAAVYNTWRSDRWQYAIKLHIGWESRCLPTTPAFDALESPSEYCYNIGVEKLEWYRAIIILDGEKIGRYVYSYRQNTNVTDGRVHRATADVELMHRIAGQYRWRTMTQVNRLRLSVHGHDGLRVQLLFA